MSYGFFVKEGKNLKAFKLTSRATFAVVNSYICLEFFSSPAEIIIPFSNCQMVTILQSPVHVTMRLIWLEFTHSTILPSYIRALTSSQMR